jgi:hypothetical protein
VSVPAGWQGEDLYETDTTAGPRELFFSSKTIKVLVEIL